MTGGPPRRASVLDRRGLDALVEVLRTRGYTVVGPTVRDGAIVLAELRSGTELPDGWGAEVGPGSYRLRRRDDGAVFNHSAGPQSWKQFLHPPRRRVWTADGATFAPADDVAPQYAFLGVRACDLAAIQVLSRVLVGGEHIDSAAADRRRGLFVVAVGCTEPGALCFCASLGTGPDPAPPYDLSLVERPDPSGSSFVVTVGSAVGAEVVDELPHRQAAAEEVVEARAALDAAARRMGRQLPDTDVPALLRARRESPVWQEIERRCLACGNCTMVCPTCFCTATENRSDLSGEHSELALRWASCFELDFSYVHGGSVRGTLGSRYRQWMTHKLSSWHDQFGASGCVGCGRCIAWCPVGIDITEEAARLAATTASEAGDGT